MDKETELVEIIAYIYGNDLYPSHKGTVFATVNEARRLARQFMQEFGNTEWGVGREWDETLEAFLECHDEENFVCTDPDTMQRYVRVSASTIWEYEMREMRKNIDPETGIVFYESVAGTVHVADDSIDVYSLMKGYGYNKWDVDAILETKDREKMSVIAEAMFENGVFQD